MSTELEIMLSQALTQSRVPRSVLTSVHDVIGFTASVTRYDCSTLREPNPPLAVTPPMQYIFPDVDVHNGASLPSGVFADVDNHDVGLFISRTSTVVA